MALIYIDYYMLFSYSYGQWQNQLWETKHLVRRPFWSPWRWAGEIPIALLNETCPGLLWKPMDAAIERLLTKYCPGGRQGNNQQNNYAKHTYFAGRFDGHCNAPVRYPEYCSIKEVRGFQRSH